MLQARLHQFKPAFDRTRARLNILGKLSAQVTLESLVY